MLVDWEERRRKLDMRFPIWKEMTISERLHNAAEEYPDYIFLNDRGKEYTYTRCVEIVRKIKKIYLDIGVSSGDSVAILMSSSAYFVFSILALSEIDAIGIPINIRLHTKELAVLLEHLEPDYMISDGTMDCVLEGYGERVYKDNKTSWILWEISKDKKHNAEKTTIPRPHRTALICCTSGSSGMAKGVMLTHDMMLRSAYANCYNRGFERGRRIYVPLPLYHVYAFIEGVLAVMYVGGEVVLPEKFEAKEALTTIEKNRVNDMLVVPSMMMKILEYPDLYGYDLSSLHAVYCSASHCPEWVWDGIRKKLRVDEMNTGYGMTEVSGASVQSVPYDDQKWLTCSLGKILDGACAGADGSLIEYKVINDPDIEKEYGEGVGELVCRGKIVSKGYYKSPDLTREKYDENGWFHTGDLGKFTEEGYLIFCGRKGDSYKFNGENVSTYYVESVMMRHQGIKKAVSFGILDNRYGQVGVLCVELEKDCKDTVETLGQYCKDHLAGFQVPKYIYILEEDQWPVNDVGKVSKRTLKNQIENSEKFCNDFGPCGQ